MAEPPILTLADIALTYGGNPLLAGASLNVLPGERIGLVGRNGSGKSTLLRIMAGLVEPDDGTRFLAPGRHVAYLDQEPDFAGFATLGEFAAFGLPEGEVFRAEIAMDGVELDGGLDPARASGGERRRAALARLLAADADLMLLDEPTNHLDIRMIEWLEGYLAETRKAFVLISHDRAFLRRLTRALLWVDRGIVRRLDKGFEAFEAWRDKIHEEEDLARHKLDRLIKVEARWAVEGISARRKRNMGRVRRLQDMRAERAAQIRRSGVAGMALDAGPKSGKLVVEAEAIEKTYGDRSIVRNFSIRVQRGDRLALVGPNGVGKTTLLNILTGAVAPDAGHVRLGTNLVPVVFDQARAALDPAQSLWDSLTHDPELGVSGKNDQVMVRGQPRHVVGYLKEFLFSDAQVRSPVSALSGGERARLLLARLMARESNLLVLDEPTNDLDVETLDLLQELIAEFDGTVLLVSHDRDFIDRVATVTVEIPGHGEATVYAGGYSDMLAQGGGRRAPTVDMPRSRKTPAVPKQAAPTAKLGYRDQLRLDRLPGEIERLETEIAKLEAFLADPALYQAAPQKFAKATEALADRQAALTAAEEEWLILEDKRTSLG